MFFREGRWGALGWQAGLWGGWVKVSIHHDKITHCLAWWLVQATAAFLLWAT
jgi:hypothetical protein